MMNLYRNLMALRTDMFDRGVCGKHLTQLDDMIKWANENEAFVSTMLEAQNLTWSQDCGPLTTTQEYEVRNKVLEHCCSNDDTIMLSTDTLGQVVSNLSIEECLEVLPDEPADYFDFDPLTGELWEDK